MAVFGGLPLGSPAIAQSAPIGSGALRIQGSSLTLYADAVTTDADQTVNVGEQARVRTCFGGVEAPCGTVLPGDPRIAGLLVRGELSGPELPQPLTLETVPGGAFVLPGFQQEGDYRLENIRLVDGTNGDVLASAEPSLAILHVREILLASATVRTLSLEELRQRGITITAENFQAFDFAVGFALAGEIVEIKLPIIYSGFGVVQPLSKPTVNLDDLPADVAHLVERWEPPRIVPFRLEAQPDEERLERRAEEDEGLRLPLFGAIVLPGTVSYLNQFFEARLVIANGAPAGSNARLDNVVGSLRLPAGNVLRVGATDPSVAPGSPVPILASGGGRLLFPGDQASAAWTVEGLVAGSHALQIDVTGELERPGRDPLPMLSRLQAAVEVVDARFNLSFSHPDVVREGEAYTLFVTVTNLSRATQNLISVDLDEEHLSGAEKADEHDDLVRRIDSLGPGQSETVEYRLVSKLDGRVVATTFQSTSSAGQGTIRLRTGVGELGIPLSPASLVLPRFSERLKPPFLANEDLYRAHMRFLGLAYSLAIAPAALTPPGLPRVIKSDVERRAVDFAQAGMRTFLHEGLLESLEVLTLDYLGNRAPLVEMDELRRSLGKGLAVGTELGRLLRAQQGARNLSAEALFDQFAETTTYTAPYVAAMLLPDAGDEGLQLEVQGSFEGRSGSLKGAAGEAGALRGLPFGELLPILRSPGETATVPFALVGHVALDQQIQVWVRNPTASAAQGRLLVIVPRADGREDRRLEVASLTVPAGGAVMLRVGGTIASPSLVDGNGAPLSTSVASELVQRPPFRLIGAVQDFRLKEEGPDRLGNMHRPNRYGNGLIYLFNRPPDPAGAQDPANYRIRSTFHGLDTAGLAASGTSDKVGSAAFVQEDGRTVAVRFSTPVSALVDPATGKALLAHEHLLDRGGLLDAWGESLDAEIPLPSIELLPLHVGGLVTGKVVRGTGEPVAGAKVQLIRSLLWDTITDTVVKLDYLGEVTTGSDGTFFFDFVENPHWDRQVLPSFTLRAIIPAGADPALQPGETQEVSSTIRLQNRAAKINIALLGRGTVRGLAVYADTREPVTSGTVQAASTLFNELKRVDLRSDGTFTIPGVPVGPITLVVRDRSGHVGYATVGVDTPGAIADALVEVPRFVPGKGTVVGVVLGATSGEAIPGTRVVVYSKGAALGDQLTDSLGRFRFDDVPEGQASLQAANWAISRVAVFTDFTLAAGETKELTLRLPEGSSRTVTGTVLFHDPITNTNVPIQGAVAFIAGPGMFAYTDAFGHYRIEGVPVQGANESYSVQAIDFARKLQGGVNLPPILDVAPDVVQAQAIVLEQMSGGVDGVVLDPLGRPFAGAEVVLYPYGTTTSGPDGSFSFTNLPLKTHGVTAHVGDGLQPGRVGYFADGAASIVYAGHRPFVTLRMRGGGVVNVLTRTSTSTGVLTPIYYKPTYYSAVEYRVRLKGSYIEDTTDQNGKLQRNLPVGPYEIVAYNPFHGIKTLTGRISYAGEIVNLEVVFEDAATVAGQVVGVDGVTPVPDVEVVMEAGGLKGQKQRTDADGRFRYELVPKGGVIVTAQGFAGNVERVGRTLGYVGTAGQVLDLIVQMKAQGTVKGRVVDIFNGAERPLAHAQFYVQEDSFPFRRIPEDGGWLTTDDKGNYQVAHVYAGGVTVVARDSGQVRRQGLVRGTLAFDWQVLEMLRIEMVTNVGALQITVRKAETGGAVADAQVRLSNNEATVTDPNGVAFFDALPLGSYAVSVFYAPNGKSGRLSSVVLTEAGQQINRTIYLDQRGEVHGTLWDDPAHTRPMGGGTVRLEGQTAGGRVTALATTSSVPDALGKFEFLGIPEGTFDLAAALPTSPRLARAQATITATSPKPEIDMVLEPVTDAYFRLFEKLKAGTSPVNVSSGLFSVRLTQPGAYDYAQLAPAPGSDRFLFPNVLRSREGIVGAEELNAERRRAGAFFSSFSGPSPVPGLGSLADPYQLVLSPKGVVRVSVFDPSGKPVSGANVTLNTAAGPFPSVTGNDGRVVFTAVPAGNLSASVSSLTTGTGGYATSSLTYDDDEVEITVALAPAVRAHGVVYQPVPDDRWNGDPSILAPAPGTIVEIRDAKGKTQLVLTDDLGVYRFTALPTGAFSLSARNNNGDQIASVAGTLVGPDGNDNLIPPLILDAGPPRLLSIAPPPGIEGVSRTAVVELVFSEPLDPAVLPVNQPNTSSYYFSVTAASGARAKGTWSSSLDGDNHQVVRFVPSEQYENSSVHSIVVAGGPGGVRDRIKRSLTPSGNVGSNFKTADGVGPSVIRTEPDLGRPVDPRVPIRFDFSEAVKATDEQLDGDLVGDAVELYWQANISGGVEWRRLPVVTYLTRSNFSLTVQAVAEGFDFTGDTLQRRVVLTGLKDVYDNVMLRYERPFRIYDKHPPVIDAVPYPAGSINNGQLLQTTKYTLVPLLRDLDDLTDSNRGGDIDRVDYFFSDPADPDHPVLPSFSAKTHPFAYSFVAAYTGDGVNSRPFPIWVRAVDTSTNQSNVVKVAMVVLPNAKPTIEAVQVVASSPVPGVPYAGSKLTATVSGFFDADGIKLTLYLELWKEGAASPFLDLPQRDVFKPDNGWDDAPSQAATFQLPLDIEEGTRLYVVARVQDTSQGLGSTGERESEHFAIADDATPPVIDDFSVRLAGAPVTHLFIGEQFYFELRAHDAETAVGEVALELQCSELFPQHPELGCSSAFEGFAEPFVLRHVAGDLYRSDLLEVSPGFDKFRPAHARLRISDRGANSVEKTIDFFVGPERDVAAPQARWRSPWQGALWPADYDSVMSAQGATLLLRLYARDTNLDVDGNPVPGRLVSIEVRGPVRNEPTGPIELAATWTEAQKVPGTDDIAGAVYEAMWRVPNRIAAGTEIPFETRLVDSAGTVTITRVTMTAVAPRRVYEAAITSVDTTEEMLEAGGNPEGPVFLLDGTTLSILPQPDGTVRRLPALFLYTGGSTESGTLQARPSVLTAPEITSYDSAIFFEPLELAVDHEVGVGTLSRIDMTKKGLLGSTATRSMVLPGETGAQARAGGSHGGQGWFGSPGGWNRPDLTQPWSVFDSLRDPHLPGGGGGSADGNAGGAGGGVVRLLAPAARVRIDGEVVADGGNGTGGGSGGGAGGAVRLRAAHLEGSGRIATRGGAGTNFSTTGGGGGGRIAVSYQSLGAAFDLATQLDASGGINDGPVPSRADRRGGAGTVFFEVVDPATGVATLGRLALANPIQPARAALTPLPALGDGAVGSIDPATGIVVLDVPRVRGELVGDQLALLKEDGSSLGSFTITGQRRLVDASAPGGFRVELRVAATAAELDAAANERALGHRVAFHGVSRLLGVDAEAAVRLVADDDLLLGPESGPVLNDRSFVTLRRGSRGLLRGEAPVVTLATRPNPGDVLLGSSIAVDWSVSDPLGLVETRQESTFAPTLSVQPLWDEPLTAKSGATTTLSIPFTGAPPSVAYAVQATNQAGRVARQAGTWPVLPNELPSGIVALAPGTPTPLRAGYPFSVGVHAADRERLAKVTLQATGPATPATQVTPVAGTMADLSYTLTLPAAADGSQAVTLQALLEDASGGATTTAPLVLPVAANGAPTATLAISAGAPTQIERGKSTTVLVQATDPDGLTRVELHTTGAATQPEQSKNLSGTSADATFTITARADAEPSTLSATATLFDTLGKSGTTAPLLIPIVANGAPTGSVALAPGAPASIQPGEATTLVVHATDPDGMARIELHAAGSVTQPVQSQTVSGTTVDATFTVTATDAATPQTVSVTATLIDQVGTTATTAVVSFDIVATPVDPELALYISGPAPPYRSGDVLEISGWSRDDIPVTAMRLEVDGTTLATSTENGLTVEWEVPHLTEPRDFTFRVVATDDVGKERQATEVVRMEPRVVTLTLQPNRSSFRPGDVVVIGATTDTAFTIASLRLEIAGATVASVQDASVSYNWTVPTVTQTTSFLIEAVAVDSQTHVWRDRRTLWVTPPDAPPAVAFTCPTDRAVLPTDYTTTLSVGTSGNTREVRFFLGESTAPFRVVTTFDFNHVASTTFDLSTVSTSTVRFRAQAVNYEGLTSEAQIEISRAAVTYMKADGQGTNNWASPPAGVLALKSGTFTINELPGGQPVAVEGLLVLGGAKVVHSVGKSLQLAVAGPFYLGCGGSIDVSSRGYNQGITYPGVPASSSAGASHLGEGGAGIPTYGSVYFPRELGGGGSSSLGGQGGGAVAISAQRVQIDGLVRADGSTSGASAAGGSVSLAAEQLAGSGRISADGGYFSGGGGAISMRYQTLDAGSTLFAQFHLSAAGGTGSPGGGAGTICLREGNAGFGKLTVARANPGRRTVLPSLGKGAAAAGSNGPTLVTGRSTAIPPYFVGHWIELRDPQTRELLGTGRVTSISGTTVQLEFAAGEAVTIQPGYLWQGVYRFDQMTVADGLQVVSADPIRIYGEQTVTGTLETDAIYADRLVIKAGAVLAHYPTDSTGPAQRLTIAVRELVVEAGGAIDVSDRGYQGGMTYPGHVGTGTGWNGGSHLGEGGVARTDHAIGETFGSVYRPQENGGGGGYGHIPGGGAVRIEAERVVLDGEIRTNGASGCEGAAGGSVWLKTTALAGIGGIAAKGGDVSSNCESSGGGGAIAVEYSTLEPGSTVLTSLQAQGGSTGTAGGAGTVLVRGGTAATYGWLTIDNKAATGQPRTILPALGSGVCRPGSGGSTLATGRDKAIPSFFIGHWVEVRSGATGALEGTWRVASIGADGRSVQLAANGEEPVTVDEGDTWQGVYKLDALTVKGDVQLLSGDPIRVAGEQAIAGSVQTDAIFADRLVVQAGSTLTQRSTASSTTPESLTIAARELVVEPGASIDVSARGYKGGATYVGHVGTGTGWNGGSHLGEGGVARTDHPIGETFGSVYRPQENGGGGGYSDIRGGGTVRIEAERVVLDGEIRANGAAGCEGAAGGSVWLKTTVLAGIGGISAKGGDVSSRCESSGGGGAIAVEYSTLELGSTVLTSLQAQGGSTGTTGGAGTVYVRGGSAPTHGRLIVDNGSVSGHRRTVLPALGAGTARSGSGGATLVTGRSNPIPPYFVGHWIEVRSESTGVLEGTWQIAAIGPDGLTVVLAAGTVGAPTVNEGDAWQGVYRFDEYSVRGNVEVVGLDPIHVFSEQVITGTVETEAIHAERLVIKPGAKLTQHLTTSGAAAERLAIEVNELVVEKGGLIDVSARGYAGGTTYPGHVGTGTGWNGGSHLGEGGIGRPDHPVGETFGSVYRPQENGGGGGYSNVRGGGAVRIAAERVVVDGVISANGQSGCEGAAGGSVWLKTSALGGTGTIEAKGGDVSSGCESSGGGGAIAVEYTTLEPGATVLGSLRAQGGSAGFTGGAGTVWVRGGSTSTFGQLTVDSGSVSGHRRTVLPSLGRGVAMAGSTGVTLVTARSRPIPAYFIGHWVEVRNAATGRIEGTWQIAAIGGDGESLQLASNAGEPVTVDEGDQWQGVYRLDAYATTGDLQVVSLDPIRVAGSQVIDGTLETDAVYADRLVVNAGGRLTQRLTGSPSAPEALTVDVHELIVEASGAIDVTGRGYPGGSTYPGHVGAGTGWNGGSHLGQGGVTRVDHPKGETFGNVYRPMENGGGGGYSNVRGGGVVHIAADRVVVDGHISANGQNGCEGAAGGSVWVKTSVLSGRGVIEAKGGDVTVACESSGGGGAISVEYTSIDPAATLLDGLRAQGGSTGVTGGAGTIYLRGAASLLGALVVDNLSVTGNRRTILPSIGRGVVQPGSAEGVVLTGRDATIPGYFVGAWMLVEGPDRIVKGVWRIAAIDGTTVTLEPKTGYPFSLIAPGDRWRGLYRFDSVTVAPGAVLVSIDPIIQIVPPLRPASVASQAAKAGDDGSEAIYGNDEAPAWDKRAVSIAVGSVPGSYRIALGPASVADPDGISEVRLSSGGRSMSVAWSTDGASFLWAGFPGQRLYLVALDAHDRVQRAGWLELPPLPPVDAWQPQLELGSGVTPRAVAADQEWLGIGDEGIWLYRTTGTKPVVSLPPHESGEEVVDLAVDGGRFLVATGQRVDLVDLVNPAVIEVPIAFGRVLDLAAGTGEAMVLLADDSDPMNPNVRLAQLLTPANETPTISPPSELALPRPAAPRLQRTTGYVHLFGLQTDGKGVIYTWPESALSEPATAQPTIGELPGGWLGVGPWQRGAVLLAPKAVRLLEHGTGGWSEVSRLDLAADPTGAAVVGSRLVVLVPGEILVYDLADPAAPVLAGRHPGSSYRAIEPLSNGEVLLWSPPMAVPPVRWDPASAVPGNGFTTVMDGLP